MNDKHRLPVYLTPAQYSALEIKAALMGVSMNAVVKMALESFLGPARKPQRSDE